MSGQPYKNQLDILKVREAYLANLKLRAELDDKNLQANRQYIRTGQLPTELTDQRTLTEKLVDTERIKIDLSNKLLEITDGIQARDIVNSLSPEQLTFLSQNFQPIKEQMKANYSLGVLAPIFVDYLGRYIDKFNQTRGVEYGLQQTTARELIANQRLILSNMASKRDILEIEDLINRLGIQNSSLGKSINKNLNEMNEILEFLPLTITELGKADNSIQKSQMEEAVNNIVKDLPTKADLAQAIYTIERMEKLDNEDGVRRALIRINEITSTAEAQKDELDRLREGLRLYREQNAISDTMEQDRKFNVLDISELKKLPIGDKREYVNNAFNVLLQQGYTSQTKVNDFVRNLNRQYSLGITDKNLTSYKKLNETNITRLVPYINALITNQSIPATGNGIQGKGLIRVRPSQVFESDIDYSVGIKPTAKFIPIGRFLINKRQLDNDIIAIKRPAGSTIQKLPSQRVSRHFGNVMRKIVGGGMPTFEEIQKLTDEEQAFLHKVAKETRIDDKLSIPTPKKDEDEKDINEFEILRGQILSGNDNTELVKKFKTILLKLSRKELIPKIQVRDLLLDLATLGH